MTQRRRAVILELMLLLCILDSCLHHAQLISGCEVTARNCEAVCEYAERQGPLCRRTS